MADGGGSETGRDETGRDETGRDETGRDETGRTTPAETKPARKPGKQPGAPGSAEPKSSRRRSAGALSGRCAGCGQVLEPAVAVAYTGFQAVDVRWGDPARPGLTLWVVDHRYHEARCTCGHTTRAVAGPGWWTHCWRGLS